MNVIMLSTDASAFDVTSAFHKRLLSYAILFDHLDVIVVARKKENVEEIGDERLRIIPAFAKTGLGALTKAWRYARESIQRTTGNAVITSQEELTGLIALTISKRYGIPWCAQVHTDIMSPFFAKFSLKNRLRKLIFLLTIKNAACVRVVSERIKKSLQEVLFRKPLVVLPIVVEREVFESARTFRRYEDSNEKDFCFILSGRLEPEKNIEVFLKAFTEVARMHPRTIARIIGKGSLEQHLKQVVRTLGLESKVFFEGSLNDARTIATYLVQADAYVSASVYEGYSMSVMEAVFAGTPVVMTDVGVAGEVIEHGISGVVVKPGDKGALVRGLLEMRSLPAHAREGYAKKALQKAHTFSQEEYQQAMKRLFELCKN